MCFQNYFGLVDEKKCRFYLFTVVNIFIGFVFLCVCIIFIFALFRIVFAAFFASAFVWCSPSSSIHGKVSSIFIHTTYTFFHHFCEKV